MASLYLLNYDSNSDRTELLTLLQQLAEYLAAQTVYVSHSSCHFKRRLTDISSETVPLITKCPNWMPTHTAMTLIPRNVV